MTETGDDSSIVFDGSGLSLDLSLVDNGAFTNVTTIDITGTGNNSLALDISDLVDLSAGSDTLFVEGDTGDTLTVSGMTANGTFDVSGVTYDMYVGDSSTLLVDQEISTFLV